MQDYSSGLPFPSPGHLPDPSIIPASPALQADHLSVNHLGSPIKAAVATKKKKSNQAHGFNINITTFIFIVQQHM